MWWLHGFGEGDCSPGGCSMAGNIAEPSRGWGPGCRLWRSVAGPSAQHENSPVLPRPNIPTPPRSSWTGYSSQSKLYTYFIFTFPSCSNSNCRGKLKKKMHNSSKTNEFWQSKEWYFQRTPNHLIICTEQKIFTGWRAAGQDLEPCRQAHAWSQALCRILAGAEQEPHTRNRDPQAAARSTSDPLCVGDDGPRAIAAFPAGWWVPHNLPCCQPTYPWGQALCLGHLAAPL